MATLLASLNAPWPRTRSGRWLAAYVSWCVGLTLRRGFGLEGLPFILLGAWFVPWSSSPEPRDREDGEPRGFRAAVLVALPCIGLTALVSTPGISDRTVFGLLTVLTTAFILIGALVALRAVTRPGFEWAVLLASLYVGSGALVISAHPSPRIDAYTFQQGGAAALVQGRNPYAEIYPNIYTLEESRRFMGRGARAIDYYVYPPASLVATTVGYMAGGDVRYAMLAAQAGFGLILWRIARHTMGAAWPATALAATYYLFPLNLYLLNSAWTDPLIACALAVFFWAVVTSRTGWWGWALGAFFSLKQYSVLALPMLIGHAWASSRRGPSIIRGVAATVVVFIPFLVWGMDDLVNDLVLEVWRTPLRADQMSIPALVLKATGWSMPGAASFLTAIAVSAWAVRKAPHGPCGAALGLLAVYLAFFLFGKQAAPNYYVFLAQLMLLCMALSGEAGAVPSERRPASSAA